MRRRHRRVYRRDQWSQRQEPHRCDRIRRLMASDVRMGSLQCCHWLRPRAWHRPTAQVRPSMTAMTPVRWRAFVSTCSFTLARSGQEEEVWVRPGALLATSACVLKCSLRARSWACARAGPLRPARAWLRTRSVWRLPMRRLTDADGCVGVVALSVCVCDLAGVVGGGLRRARCSRARART